jgi:hypothetical protein
MSFDIFLTHFKSGEAAPISDEARGAIQTLIAATQHDGQDEFGFFIIELADGSSFEMSAKGIADDPAFANMAFYLRGFGPATVNFIYDISLAGHMTILNAQARGTPDNPLFITTRPNQESDLPDMSELSHAFCKSPQGLQNFLSDDFDRWSDFKDQVTSAPHPSPSPNKSLSFFDRIKTFFGK